MTRVKLFIKKLEQMGCNYKTGHLLLVTSNAISGYLLRNLFQFQTFLRNWFDRVHIQISFIKAKCFL